MSEANGPTQASKKEKCRKIFFGTSASPRRNNMGEAQYEIRFARQSGGKAGKGCNKTSTVQVLYGSCIVKQFRFLMGNSQSIEQAIAKAEAYVITKKGGEAT
jgi:hypothetical protein